MVKKNIYNVFDIVSETFLGDFIANNEKVAKNALVKFCEQNKADICDLKLVHVATYFSPIVVDDMDDEKAGFDLVDISDLYFDDSELEK